MSIVSTLIEGATTLLPMLASLGISVLQSLATGILNALPSILPQVITMMTGIVQAITECLPMLLETGITILIGLFTGLVEAVPQILPLITELFSQVIIMLTECLPLLLEAGIGMLTGLIAGIAEALPTLLPQIVELILVVVQAIVDSLPLLLDAGCQLLTALVQGILTALPVLIEALPQLIEGIISFLTSAIPQLVDAEISLLTALVEALPEIIGAIVEALPQIIDGICNGLLEALPAISAAGVKLITALVDALPEIISTIVDALPQIIDGICNGLLEALPQIIDAGLNLLTSLIGALPEIITTIVNALPQIISGIVNGLLDAIPELISAGVQLFVALIENLPTIILEICKAAPQIVKSLAEAFGKLASDMWDMGKKLVMGIFEGISKAKDWLWGKLKEWCDNILDGIKSFFGIHSPSKVMEEEVGAMLMKGMANGVEKNTNLVTDQFQKLYDNLMEQKEQQLISEEEFNNRLGALRDEELTDLKTKLNEKELSEAEYYKKLEAFRDKYFEEGSDGWQTYTDEINQYNQSVLEDTKNSVKAVWEEIAKEAEEKGAKVADAIGKMSDKLKNYGTGKLEITTKTFKGEGPGYVLNENGAYQMVEDRVVKELPDFSKDIAALKEYERVLLEVKDKGTPKEIFELLRDSSVEEGLEFAKTLLAAPEWQYQEYVKGLEEKEATANHVAELLYQEESEEAEKAQAKVQETIDTVKNQLAELGIQIPQDFFQTGGDAAEQFALGFEDKVKNAMKRIQTTLNNTMNALTPQFSARTEGGLENGGNIVNNTFNYNLAPSGETTREQLVAIERADQSKKMRGAYA